MRGFSLLIVLRYSLNFIHGETFYCSIHFVVDYPLWKLTYTTRADQDYFRTNTLLSAYIYRNVEGLNELYNHYRFPYTSKTKDTILQFFVHGITIVTQSICDGKTSDHQDPDDPIRDFCEEDINSDRLLDLVARFSDYHGKTSNSETACLYYGLTSRILKLKNEKGIALGWSWRGHLCYGLEELPGWSVDKKGFNPRYSGNVGIITTNFDASDYSLNKCEMTFFHEIGHSMNADHDNADEFQDRKDECNPSDTNGGSYLMYASSTEGLLPNNRAYSHCSLDSISKYMENLGRGNLKCLSTTKTVKSKCDGTFSTDEICDEYGTTGTCCTSDCKLKPGAACSPSAGSCCRESCQYHPLDYQCRAESECKTAIKCSGTSSICPEDDAKLFKPDKTLCRDGTLLCVNGSCELSICALHSLLPCSLKGKDEDLCVIACLQTDGTCVSYHTIDTSTKILYLPYGSSCNDNHGYCDQSHQCLPLLLDENTNFIGSGFSFLLLSNYSSILKHYWWIFLLFLLGQIIIIPIVLLYFRSHCIPSDNPLLQ